MENVDLIESVDHTAAAGYGTVPVFKNRVVGIIGTGDEIVEPGKPPAEGNLYASNIKTLAAWCNKYKMKTGVTIVKKEGDRDWTDFFSALFNLVS